MYGDLAYISIPLTGAFVIITAYAAFMSMRIHIAFNYCWSTQRSDVVHVRKTAISIWESNSNLRNASGCLEVENVEKFEK